MKILLLGHDDIASFYALDRLIRSLAAHDLDVRLSGPLPSSRGAPEALARLQRIDAALCKRFLAAAHPTLGAAKSLPKPNEPGGLEELRRLRPELIVSVRYRRILKDAAIGVPRHGVLNLHSGLLPDYKGVMATFWAMLNAEPEIGCTLHSIVDGGIDTGPVIGRSAMPARRGESYLANVLRLYPAGCDMIAAAVAAIDAGGRIAGDRQDPGLGRYYTTPDDGAVERFLASGLVLADGGELDGLERRPHPAQRTGAS